MPNIELFKFSPINSDLKKLIKFFWIFRSCDEADIQGKLIPMNNIDLIINLASPIKYISSSLEETFEKSHFCGIQNNYRIVKQKGNVDIIGVSFFSTGFYPFIKIPVSEFANKIVIIDDLIQGFDKQVERIVEIDSNQQRINAIEEILAGFIDLSLLPEKNYDSVINDFLLQGDSINIENYCKKHSINQKTLERFFNKYVGTTPKAFLNTTKFQKTIKRLRIGEFDSMSDVGYEFNYYDQTHFINSFKSFVGKTPLKHLKQNDLIIDFLAKK